MSEADTPDLLAIAEQVVQAYNNKDHAALEQLLKPDFAFAHHGRGIQMSNRDEWMAIVRSFAEDAMPDRHMGEAIRTARNGNVVFRDYVWTGTPTVDIPGFGPAGEKIELQLCTVLTFDSAGIVVEYNDYG